MNMELEKRLQLLEEKFEYQEQTIDTLNEVIIRQQETIDKLEADLELLRDQVNAANLNPEDINEPPPHY